MADLICALLIFADAKRAQRRALCYLFSLFLLVRAWRALLFSLFTHFLFISGTEITSLFPFHSFSFHFGHGDRLSFPFDSLSKPNRAQNQSSLKIHSIPQTKTAHEPSIFENNVTLNRFNNNRPFYHYSQRMHKKKAC